MVLSSYDELSHSKWTANIILYVYRNTEKKFYIGRFTNFLVRYFIILWAHVFYEKRVTHW
ncbi:Uncharacterised protein [Fluoribacter dumoffii]|uniref:Uncharacterized protein n=1 Tax=Fluoribacter dumoffii TaxID=463 RepID=A0A377G8W0_9GAMM|nr:hypothetical protein Ldum_0865 [Fluoribacter dumoffii NY 23]STO20910.1 Uncharacterised protein [Fluoribacter dumoffii]